MHLCRFFIAVRICFALTFDRLDLLVVFTQLLHQTIELFLTI